MYKIILIATSVIFLYAGCSSFKKENSLKADFDTTPDRVWAGQDFWAIPMENWQVKNGRLECVRNGLDNKLIILTRRISNDQKDFNISAQIGMLDKGNIDGTAGFCIGMKDNEDPDVRAACYFGTGLRAGINTEGTVFIGEQTSLLPENTDWSDLTLKLDATAAENHYLLTLYVSDKKGNEIAKTSYTTKEDLSGYIAVVNNHMTSRRRNKGSRPRFWFDNLSITGEKVERIDDNSFGPILWSMYTLSRNVLKLTAQMPPIGKEDSRTVSLQLNEKHKWETVQTAEIDADSRTATFKMKEWNDKEDAEYRLVWKDISKNNESYYHGTIRKDPKDKPLKLGALTCQFHFGFPYTPVVQNLFKKEPDMLYFSGDQIYEPNGGYGIIRFPADSAILNYLGKWYMFGWAFGDIMRDRPTVCTPDDHDVFHGNLWGAGGRKITQEEWKNVNSCGGGYLEPAQMINVVHKTQCSHLPDPFDSTPMKQGISVWYTDLVYGNVSFAIISDRIFKSGTLPVAFWPEGRRDHLKEPVSDYTKLDKPGLQLLGERQEKFIKEWIRNWKGANMKVLLSQTILANVATHHGQGKMLLYGDLDSGGWPRSGRNRALEILRKASVFQVSGDQHIPSIVKYGIDEYSDAGWSYCTPAITVMYERRFLPKKAGLEISGRPEHGLPNTGHFIDGFGNKNYVYAIGNPEENTRTISRYERARKRASGYGTVIFNNDNRSITMNAYRFPKRIGNEEKQFPGWPFTINVSDNDGRKPFAPLPSLKIAGINKPVIEIINEESGELVSSIRVNNSLYEPNVFRDGTYTVRIGNPELNRWKEIKGLKPLKKGEESVIELTL